MPSTFFAFNTAVGLLLDFSLAAVAAVTECRKLWRGMLCVRRWLPSESNLIGIRLMGRVGKTKGPTATGRQRTWEFFFSLAQNFAVGL